MHVEFLNGDSHARDTVQNKKKHASVIKPSDDSYWFQGSYHKAWTGNPSQSSISSGRPGGSTPTVSPNGSRWCPVGRRRGMDTPLCQLTLFLHVPKNGSFFLWSVGPIFSPFMKLLQPNCGLIWEAGQPSRHVQPALLVYMRVTAYFRHGIDQK